jgi:excisionase family DNA binding protein
MNAPAITAGPQAIRLATALPDGQHKEDPGPAATAFLSDNRPLLTPAEVAAMFRVSPKTVTLWANEGKLRSVRTLGGHRRYFEADARALLTDTAKADKADDVASSLVFTEINRG